MIGDFKFYEVGGKIRDELLGYLEPLGLRLLRDSQ